MCRRPLFLKRQVGGLIPSRVYGMAGAQEKGEKVGWCILYVGEEVLEENVGECSVSYASKNI